MYARSVGLAYIRATESDSIDEMCSCRRYLITSRLCTSANLGTLERSDSNTIVSELNEFPWSIVSLRYCVVFFKNATNMRIMQAFETSDFYNVIIETPAVRLQWHRIVDCLK